MDELSVSILFVGASLKMGNLIPPSFLLKMDSASSTENRSFSSRSLLLKKSLSHETRITDRIWYEGVLKTS